MVVRSVNKWQVEFNSEKLAGMPFGGSAIQGNTQQTDRKYTTPEEPGGAHPKIPEGSRTSGDAVKNAYLIFVFISQGIHRQRV